MGGCYYICFAVGVFGGFYRCFFKPRSPTFSGGPRCRSDPASDRSLLLTDFSCAWTAEGGTEERNSLFLARLCWLTIEPATELVHTAEVGLLNWDES